METGVLPTSFVPPHQFRRVVFCFTGRGNRKVRRDYEESSASSGSISRGLTAAAPVASRGARGEPRRLIVLSVVQVTLRRLEKKIPQKEPENSLTREFVIKNAKRFRTLNE